MRNYYFLLYLLAVSLMTVIIGISPDSSQVIKITYPESRAIFQRENDNTGTIYLSGSLYQPSR